MLQTILLPVTNMSLYMAKTAGEFIVINLWLVWWDVLKYVMGFFPYFISWVIVVAIVGITAVGIYWFCRLLFVCLFGFALLFSWFVFKICRLAIKLSIIFACLYFAYCFLNSLQFLKELILLYMEESKVQLAIIYCKAWALGAGENVEFCDDIVSEGYKFFL